MTAQETTSAAPAAPLGHRVVVGVDGSPSSIQALEWAARQAELTGATLEAIQTWEWPTSYGWSLTFPTGYDPAADAQKQLDDALAPVRQARPGLAIDAKVVEGHPAPVLVGASRGADALVVGCRGHGEFVGMLLGSVSEYLTTMAHCPVVVVRESQP
jgi:nucleotide-binding universal stress UspA family protein